MIFTPGHSPGHVTYAMPGALLSGDVLFQGSVGRVDLPGGDWATLERSIEALLRTLSAGDRRLSRTHGRHDARARARQQPVPQRAPRARARRRHRRLAGSLKLAAAKIKAPRGTFDVLGEEASRRSALEARARSILEGAGYERIETPVFEATELFARGVGESTDIVRKEMFTLEDQAGRSLTLRPEGTAPVCRAYVEHGMHKRRQPVKLWYLSSFFRHERAQAGRYRQFWQVGAEAIGSEDPAVDAESISLLAALLDELGVRELRLRLSSLGSLQSRREYRERLQAHLRANEAQPVRGCPRAGSS